MSSTMSYKMRSFSLFLLSLMAACEVWSEVKKCRGEWAEFNSHNISCTFEMAKGRIPKASKRTLNVIIEHGDVFPECNSQSTSSSGTKKLQIELEYNASLQPFIQTAYKTAKTTITCDPGKKYKSKFAFFCKEDDFTCEDISSRKSDEKVSRTDGNSGFNMTISNVSSKDAGVYWCGLKSNATDHKDYKLKKIQLYVKDITKLERSPMAGQNFTYWCDYSKVKDGSSLTKFICKGEDPSTCHHLVNNTKPDVNKRFSMKDEKTKKNITITMREVSTDDSGTYWCGAKTTDNQCSNIFINKFTMTVVQTTTAPAESRGVFSLVIAVIVCGVVLLFVIVWILVYKRFSHSRNPTNAAAKQRCKEDYVYEEIPERLHNSGSQNTMNTVYVTASLPANNPASLHYSTIHFRNSSDKTEAPIPKPSSPACQYSTLKYNNTPTYSTVSQPPRPAQDPLYSNINKTPQQ